MIQTYKQPKRTAITDAMELLQYDEWELVDSIQTGLLKPVAFCEATKEWNEIYGGFFCTTKLQISCHFLLSDNLPNDWHLLETVPLKGKFLYDWLEEETNTYYQYEIQKIVNTNDIYICGYSILKLINDYWISPDFKTILFDYQHYDLTPNQSHVIEFLFNQREKGKFCIRQEDVLDAIEYEGLDRRLSKIFRKGGKKHPLWRKIFHFPQRGWIGLKLPKELH